MIKLAISVFFAISTPIGFISLPGLAMSFNKQACNPIGRITEGTSANFNRGQVVCEGDVISEPNEVVFLCFTNAALIHLSGKEVGVWPRFVQNPAIG